MQYGGITDGISPLEMAGAYAAIANNGEYIKPTFYSKVVDSDGNVVLTPNQERRRVISEQNAYIVKSIMQEPVRRGTATFCSISGMDVSAKTGTTDYNYDRWLCGFTPYYTAACWFGYDDQETVSGFGTNPAGLIWDAIMTDIHKGLPSARFTQPSGIVTQTICKATGCIAQQGCGATYREIFTADNLPERCQGHGTQMICSESNKLATEFCEQYCEVQQKPYGGVVPKEQLKFWTPSGASENKMTETCPIHTKPKDDGTSNNNGNTTTTNNTTNTNTSTNTNKTNTNTNKNTGSTNTNVNASTNNNKTNTNTNVNSSTNSNTQKQQ